MNRCWAAISLSVVAENYRTLARLAGPINRVAPVVKADAYGHGLLPVARACISAGANRFAVATLDEALTLRRAGISTAIYTLSPLPPSDAESAVQSSVTPFISGPEFYLAFAQAAENSRQPAPFWIALDTGMGREGMTLDDALVLRQTPALLLEGISTHLSSADELDPAPTDGQLAEFAEALTRLDPDERLLVSWANSPAMLRFNFAAGRRKVVHRPGAALYGIEAYPGVGGSLLPALTLQASVTLIRAMPAGAAIGYGQTHTLSRPSTIATVAMGYGDGLARELSNRGVVLIRGRRCPLVGRISMDQCQADVTDLASASVGDVATLIGTDGEQTITAAEMARLAQTTCHASTTMLTRRVERRWA